MPFLDNHRAKIYYEIYGEGPPLLMIAGLSSDSKSWQYVKKSLGGVYTLIIFDNRGCGRTEYTGAFSLSDIASDAISLIDHLGYKKVHLLGHSMGGMIAMELALDHPDRLNKLVLASSCTKLSAKARIKLEDLYTKWLNGYDMVEWYRLMFEGLFSEKVTGNKQFMDAAIIFSMSYPYAQKPEGFKDQVEAIINFDISHSYVNIDHTTMIISGSEDMLILAGESRQLMNINGNSSFHLIDGAAHTIHAEMPGEFAEIVLEFLGADDRS
jgi:pimeloyl-ACP methyl ester carboxylesterase